MEHPLKCPNCSEYMYIEFHGTRFEEGNKGFGVKLPVTKCRACGYRKCLVSKEQCLKFQDDIMPSIKEGKFHDVSLKYFFSKLDAEKRIPEYEHLGFTYDLCDYHLIPGLWREWDDYYLTPVFFDKDVLLYYNNHPDYSVQLDSFSSGNIYLKGESLFAWGFGINRSGKIFKWLGDLNDDFKSEKMKPHLKRFQASNIPSDHDIVSKFYFSQTPFSLTDAFQESDNENKLFELKNLFDEKMKSSFGVCISKLNIEDISDFYKHPILEERNQIFEAYLSLNKFLIENLQEAELRKFLLQAGIPPSELKKEGKKIGSLKLLGLAIIQLLKIQNSDEIIAPLFVLNDLRQLHGHLSKGSFTPKYLSCKNRLGANEGTGDFDFYEIVITALIQFYSQILTAFPEDN